ncbi:MAG: tetratricopeptide repeat protein [Candidatus Heimdallarchaeota archaeon]|nr:tetratricopeptide repeat protein [Candidatus Heimdallarchaeota archaeon]
MNDPFLDFDEMWDYSNPQETEIKFRDLLSKTEMSGNKSYYLQLQTQLARTQSLQQKFTEAHAILNKVEVHLTDDLNTAKVRFLLERGRAYRSNNEKSEAMPLFKQAFEISEANDLDFFAVDAAHMLGVAETEEKQVVWNLKAINIAEQSTSRRANNWLGSLYNNLGWTYNFQEKYLEALDLFEKALIFREKQGKQETILSAKWCVGRTYRYLERNVQALDLQLQLQKDREINNLSPGGYNQEELGELYLLKSEKTKSATHFKLAYEELSKDIWITRDEPERLERIKSLSATD